MQREEAIGLRIYMLRETSRGFGKLTGKSWIWFIEKEVEAWLPPHKSSRMEITENAIAECKNTNYSQYARE